MEWKWYNIQAVAQSASESEQRGHWKLNNRLRSTSLTLDEKRELLNRFVRGSRSKILRKHELKGKSKQWKLQGKNELVFVLVLRAKALIQILSCSKERPNIQWFREFDPGSGWTLAARLTHASRTVKSLRGRISGGRVSNAWVTCPYEWNNVWKRTLIPHNASGRHLPDAKDLSHKDGLASD